MSPPFQRVAIIGAGLLGASLGLALKSRRLAEFVVGVGRRPGPLETAQHMGALDDIGLDARAASAGADLIVIATPADLVASKLDEIRDAVAPDAIVTDVASTKRVICAHADATWSTPRRFIGSHPMAGSEKYGPEHARADFYEHSVCLVEDSGKLDPEARDRVAALWEAVGARVVAIDPARHDALLARTSHLPHVAAAALAIVAGRQHPMREVIGAGFRDTTRIAAGRASIWRDICLTNREAILDALAELRQTLEAFEDGLADADAAAIEAFFEEGRDARQRTTD